MPNSSHTLYLFGFFFCYTFCILSGKGSEFSVLLGLSLVHPYNRGSFLDFNHIFKSPFPGKNIFIGTGGVGSDIFNRVIIQTTVPFQNVWARIIDRYQARVVKGSCILWELDCISTHAVLSH